MKLSDLGESLNKINTILDENKDKMPDELYLSITKEVNKLLMMALNAVRDKYTEEFAINALEFIKKSKSINNEAH